MNDAVEAGSTGETGEVTGEIVGTPESKGTQTSTQETPSVAPVETPQTTEANPPTTPPIDAEKSELQEGQWWLREGVLGSGDRPQYLLEKYGYNQETQAKAYPDAERRIGEQNQRLGAFTGAPDKYDFSAIEDDSFVFDTKDAVFGQFVTECQNNNVSQDFAVKVATLAKSMLKEPQANLEQEATKYGAAFESDKANIKNWVNNNNAEADGLELLESVKSAGAMRALRNLMNTNGFNVPTGNQVPDVPQETLKDIKTEFGENIYGGDNLANNPDKINKWVEKFNKITG